MGGGGNSRPFWLGMCCWENENWPIHLPNFDPKFDLYLLAIINVRRLCGFFAKFMLGDFSKIGYRKELWPIYLPTFRFEMGSFIYHRGVKMGPIFTAHPQYPLSTEYPHPQPNPHLRIQWGNLPGRCGESCVYTCKFFCHVELYVGSSAMCPQ